MSKQTMGEFLSSLRHAQGYTQQQVADKLNVSNRTVSAWERDSAVPDVLLLPAIAELYGVTVDELLRGSRVERDSDMPTFSKQSELSMQRKKVSKYILQAYILLGVSILGQLLLFMGYLNSRINTDDSIYITWTVFEFLGLALTVVCTAVLLALWKSTESALTPIEGNEGLFYKLYTPVVVYLYIWSFASLFCSLALSLLVYKLMFATVGITAYVVFGICIGACGSILHTYAVAKWNKLDKGAIAKLWIATIAINALCVAIFSVLLFAAERVWSKLLIYAAVAYALTFVLMLFVMLFERMYIYKYGETDGQLFYGTLCTIVNLVTSLIFIAVTLGFFAVSVITPSDRIDYFSNDTPFTVVEIAVGLSSLIMLVLGCVLPHIDLIKHASDSLKSTMKRNARLYRKIWLWGLIPLGVGAVCCVVGFYCSAPVFLAGAAILTASVIACTTICLAKREKLVRSQN